MEKDRFLNCLFESFQPTYMDFNGGALNFGTASHFSNAEILWQTDVFTSQTVRKDRGM